MQEKEAVWQEIRNRVFQNMDLSGEISDKELKRMIAEEVRQFGKVHLLSLHARETCEEQIFNSFRKLDILQELLDDPEVTEIMVNGAAHIFYEKHGVLYPWKKGQLSEERLRDMIQQMVGAADRIVNEAQPIVDTRLPDGSRVNIVLQPVSLDGSCISIRKFCGIPMNLAYLVQSEAISEEAAELLKLLVKAGYNIFISGGTGSGKTTFLNALSEYIPEGERVITIEDSAELQLNNIKNLVRLETRPANGQGAQEISIRDLIRTALRMRPDRIIVGEVRGAEALDMLQAMNTGHAGSMSTGHGNSIEGMLRRLEAMYMMAMPLDLDAIRVQIAEAIDIMIHVEKIRGQRKITEISELASYESGRFTMVSLMRIDDKGRLAFTGNKMIKQDKFKRGDTVYLERLQKLGIIC